MGGLVLVAALTLVGAWFEAHPAHSYAGLHLRGAPPPAAYLVLLGGVVALLWRRTAPVAVFALSAVAACVWAALGQIDGAALVPMLVATYALAVRRPRAWTVVAGLAGAAAVWTTEGLLGPFGWLGGPNATMWPELLAAGALGAYLSARRRWLLAESERVAQVERARAEETRRQIDAERVRIARELHDVVAHSISMIGIQAAAAGVLLAEDPDAAAEALREIRQASRDGLRELRTILQVLRFGDSEPPAVPVPGVEAIGALVAAAVAAGTPTTLEVSGDLGALPPEVALAAYRIVQESLTNVVRHAGGARTTVVVSREPGSLRVEVVDTGGRLGVGSADGTGSGLTGMRERACALGGSLEAGPRPDGGFAVLARLPARMPDSPGRPDGSRRSGRVWSAIGPTPLTGSVL
jgi:signal transduction histidine kinase